ncbi:phosphoglucomutase (alpha-D-glucose-1,6-bisphosphate-dependent) [Flavobacteriaceae bacterium UJ101]|nr:phosphoglucomutase (alpha-D-glucose-1,6-bisphosphate-dependent) [Flavobacteriaceae bacterium UJ101]
MDNAILEKAKIWLNDEFDAKTQQEVQNLIDNDPKTLEEAFYKNLEFGTGGMRGIMGVGTNRLNQYTLGMATQGLANYLKKQITGKQLKVAITHDVRNNSTEFAKIVADILSANGIKVYLTDGFRATPILSFAVRHYNCDAGIVLTASHNPPEYNGYKVYWNDGAQIVPPHDHGIINEVNNTTVKDILFNGNNDLIEYVGDELDQAFIKASVSNISQEKTGRDDVKIVFTSIHGTAIKTTPLALEKAGFTDIHVVQEQANPDPYFSTVKSPNPEEPEALKMATDLADKIGADIVIGTDPDADRLGIAVRDFNGKMTLLNGNQTNVVLTHYLLQKWQKEGKINGNQFIGSTIVTSDVFFDLAKQFDVTCKAGLTGFKWIGKMIHDAEGKEDFIGGGEESFGFMVGDFVRDKDSVTSTLLACEIAAVAKANGSSFYNELAKIYTQVGCYQEHLIALVKKGLDGAEQIKNIMIQLRENPLTEIAGSKVVRIDDYQSSISKNRVTETESTITIPKSNVLIYYTEDGTKIAARPSGTEPKIKFYFSVKGDLKQANDFPKVQQELQKKIDKIIIEMKLD